MTIISEYNKSFCNTKSAKNATGARNLATKRLLLSAKDD